MGNGILKVEGESFNFSNGEKYVIFARGTSAESLVTSACVPNVTLAEARRTVAILDRIVKSLSGLGR